MKLTTYFVLAHLNRNTKSITFSSNQLNVVDCIFRDNIGAVTPGIDFTQGNNALLEDTLFINNSATISAGGAVRFQGSGTSSILTLLRVQFLSNFAALTGPAVALRSGNVAGNSNFFCGNTFGATNKLCDGVEDFATSTCVLTAGLGVACNTNSTVPPTSPPTAKLTAPPSFPPSPVTNAPTNKPTNAPTNPVPTNKPTISVPSLSPAPSSSPNTSRPTKKPHRRTRKPVHKKSSKTGKSSKYGKGRKVGKGKKESKSKSKDTPKYEDARIYQVFGIKAGER
jgi:hypothetical protein